VNHEEVKNKLFTNPWVREAYENLPLPLAIARAVVERRKELGLTQGELAERMGTSQAQVWRIESGAFNPTAKTLSRLEEALGISLGNLYREYQQTAQLSPREQLEGWRNSGLLIMSDEDFEHTLELEEVSPGQLRKLVRLIMSIELDDGDKVQLVVRVKEADELDHTRPPKRLRKLELSATL
jgi:transcriptional regulator with XRE-family HTH domain